MTPTPDSLPFPAPRETPVLGLLFVILGTFRGLHNKNTDLNNTWDLFANLKTVPQQFCNYSAPCPCHRPAWALVHLVSRGYRRFCCAGRFQLTDAAALWRTFRLLLVFPYKMLYLWYTPPWACTGEFLRTRWWPGPHSRRTVRVTSSCHTHCLPRHWTRCRRSYVLPSTWAF